MAADLDEQFFQWLYGEETGHTLMYTLVGLGSAGRWKCFCGAEGESLDPYAGWADHVRTETKEAKTDD